MRGTKERITATLNKHVNKTISLVILLIVLLSLFSQPALAKTHYVGKYKSEKHMHYKKKGTSITVDKIHYKDTWMWVAHVKTKNYKKIATASANGKYGHGTETTSHAAKRLNAVLCVNGDYSDKSLNYPTLRGGKVANKGTLYDGVYSRWDGKLTAIMDWKQDYMDEKGKLLMGMKASKAVKKKLASDTFKFAPVMLAKGKILCAKGGSLRQRTFIGSNGNPGDMYIVVTNGRWPDGSSNDGTSKGLTGYSCAKFLKKIGCKTGFMLDGGGSSTMVFNGQVLNSVKGSERPVVDFLYVKK